jgi:two-component system, NarL family, sensor kinase
MPSPPVLGSTIGTVHPIDERSGRFSTPRASGITGRLRDGRALVRKGPMSVTRAVLTFAVSGTVVLLLIGVVGVVVMQRVGQAEAIRQAKGIASVTGRAVIQPHLTNGIINGDATSVNDLDTLVQDNVVVDPIVRVKIWAPDGTIVYSDEPELIGRRFSLGAEELAVLRTSGVEADVSDLRDPENLFERDFGRLLEVYLPVHTPNGQPLLFEAYLLYDSVTASARQLWLAFLPVLALALVALAVLQIPLAYRLAARVRAGQLDRERLLQRAIDASDLERRRIAGDLHDGPVQQLAGVSMSLAAAADRVAQEDPAAAATLRDAGERTRLGMRSLRSSLMGIYPPTLERAGIHAALADLTAPLSGYGIEVDLRVSQDLHISPQVESLLFRIAQEAVRNVTAHADAGHVEVLLAGGSPAVTLTIRDDGAGFSPSEVEAARTEGHLGLRLITDLAADAGAVLTLTSAPGKGTTVQVEVPSA